MDLQLRGKRAPVTGSTAGIGLAAATGLFREGVSAVVNGRTPERVEQAVRKIKGVGDGGKVTGIAADLSTAEGVAGLVRQLPDVDILVNNLGIFEPKPFEEIPDPLLKAWGIRSSRSFAGRDPCGIQTLLTRYP
jgi:NAD(P)-dependent dehydrogenase (short-subunit alcohol dehydrogenase family)